MAKQELEPEKYNPDDNLTIFATRGLILWLVVALVIHVLVIGGTSVGYVVKTVFKTEQTAEEQADAENAGESGEGQEDKQAEGQDDAEPGADAGEEDETKDEGGSDADSAETDAGDGDDGEKSQEELMEERKDTDVVREAGETASPDEIPGNPEDLGIDIDETN